MKQTKRLANLIGELEYIIGNQCYNPNSYDGWTGVEGCEFRYPVCIQENKNDEDLSKKWGIIYDVEFSQIYTMKYKFGSNHLFIGDGLVKILQKLEDRYNIDFDQLEKEYLKNHKDK